MRSLVMLGIANVLVGSPLMSQSYSGRMEGSMGIHMPKPDTTQNGLSPTDGRTDASQRIQSNQEFAELQKKSPEELESMAANHRKSAEALATAARAGATIPSTAKDRIRGALAEDIAAWRAEFRLARQEWQAMRDQWLGDNGTKTANDWAIRRADWFAARDSWIAKQTTVALAPGHR